jgi:hypothetical protein
MKLEVQRSQPESPPQCGPLLSLNQHRQQQAQFNVQLALINHLWAANPTGRIISDMKPDAASTTNVSNLRCALHRPGGLGQGSFQDIPRGAYLVGSGMRFRCTRQTER